MLWLLPAVALTLLTLAAHHLRPPAVRGGRRGRGLAAGEPGGPAGRAGKHRPPARPAPPGPGRRPGRPGGPLRRRRSPDRRPSCSLREDHPRMTPTIAVTGVSKSFRRIPVLDSVSFEAGPGITGVLGPNGAGKTTLLRILATALAPDSGSVRAARARRLDRRGAAGHPTRARVPAPGAGPLPDVHRVRLRRLHRGAQGDHLHRGAASRGPSRAHRGRPGGPDAQADGCPLRRDAPPGGVRPGPAGQPGAAGPRRADGRPRPGPAPAVPRGGQRRGARPVRRPVDAPHRGHPGRLLARRRRRPRPGPLPGRTVGPGRARRGPGVDLGRLPSRARCSPG